MVGVDDCLELLVLQTAESVAVWMEVWLVAIGDGEVDYSSHEHHDTPVSKVQPLEKGVIMTDVHQVEGYTLSVDVCGNECVTA